MHWIALGVPAAGRAGEHLVPRAEAGQRPVHPHPVLLAAGDQLAQRKLGQQLVDLVGVNASAARVTGSPGVRSAVGGLEQRVAPGAGHPGRGALHQLRADQQVVGQFALALAGVQLGLDGVPPGVDRVAPAVDPVGPQPDAVGSERAVENVGLHAVRTHRHMQRLDPDRRFDRGLGDRAAPASP